MQGKTEQGKNWIAYSKNLSRKTTVLSEVWVFVWKALLSVFLHHVIYKNQKHNWMHMTERHLFQEYIKKQCFRVTKCLRLDCI